MNDLFTGQNIFDGAMFLIVVTGIIATWSNSRGTKKSDDERDALTTIKIKDAAISALQSENSFLKINNQKYGERIAVLEADNLKLQALVQNRNPELEIFMKNTTNSIAIIEKSLEALLKIHATPNITVNNQPNG